MLFIKIVNMMKSIIFGGTIIDWIKNQNKDNLIGEYLLVNK